MKNFRPTLAVVGLTIAIFAAAPVMAIGPGSGRANAETAPAAAGANAGAAQQRSANGDVSQAALQRAEAQTRLADNKLKACENRQQAIKNIMTRISQRGQKQLDLFGTIAARAEDFYTTKGYQLANYDSLVAAVNTQHSVAQTTVDSIASDGTGFDCNGTDPKGFVGSFQDSLNNEINALQAYRVSVKNLIVGIKSVVGTTSSTAAGADNTNQATSGGSQ